MYILASSSPRRKELLGQIISSFAIIPPNVDENIIFEDPYDLPTKLSLLKATEVFKKHHDDIIIASDTIVVIDKQVLGKPHDQKDAERMLKLLSGRSHEVITGYTILSKEKYINRCVITKVYFNVLSEDLIREYIDSGSPLDKAGAYGIQDTNFSIVNHIEGSYNNVIGLPIEDLKKFL